VRAGIKHYYYYYYQFTIKEGTVKRLAPVQGTIPRTKKKQTKKHKHYKTEQVAIQ